MPRLASVLLLAPLLATSSGCAQAINYADPEGPRFFRTSPPRGPAKFDGALDVVTLNLAFSREIERTKQLFEHAEELRRADIVLLQEMDAPGTEALAQHLGMAFVYYPAIVHPKTGRDFGNAILSRWRLTHDRKLLLPHCGFADGSQRTATCARVETPLDPVFVCSLHLATPLELSPLARREQALRVAREIGAERRVVVGGDFNGHRVGAVLVDAGFEWPTRDIGTTRWLFSLDHLFVRGFRAEQVGKLSDMRGASDHAAVWTRLVWR